MMNFSCRRFRVLALAAPLSALATAIGMVSVQAAPYGVNSPVTAAQRSTARQVAAAGVPLSALAANAPDEYTVRRGDTLWDISGKFLKSPWRWPQLWGMNLQDIRNPHLIYPGQQLVLERVGGRAYLRTRRSAGAERTVHVSPHTRVELLDPQPLPTLQFDLIEPFLTQPLVVDGDAFERAPRIVAQANSSRVMMAEGDRAYARGPADAPLRMAPGATTDFRVFRTAVPLKDPVSGEILGYEGQYVGQARLVRGESQSEEPLHEVGYAPPYVPASGETDATTALPPGVDTDPTHLPVPATLDIVSTKQEIRAGDRLMPEPPAQYLNYAPHAPGGPVDARVVSVYGNAVRFAGNNQVVAINKGARDGMERGDVLAVLSSGKRLVDTTGADRELMQLPDERNGLAMVFRTFDRVSYVLVMEVTSPVEVGDKLVNPL